MKTEEFQEYVILNGNKTCRPVLYPLATFQEYVILNGNKTLATVRLACVRFQEYVILNGNKTKIAQATTGLCFRSMLF